MISDIDEIPDPKKIKNFNKEKICLFCSKKFSTKIKSIKCTIPNYNGTKLYKEIFEITSVAKKYKNKKKFWKIYRPIPQLIFDGGWHFSFLKFKKYFKKNKILRSSRI